MIEITGQSYIAGNWVAPKGELQVDKGRDEDHRIPPISQIEIRFCDIAGQDALNFEVGDQIGAVREAELAGSGADQAMTVGGGDVDGAVPR